MIDLTTKIHDKFTLEFKVGFNTSKNQNLLETNDFVMNTWIFVPNSLDINREKYTKDDFYRDLKSDVRFITPPYSLHDLATDPTLLPNQALAIECHETAADDGDTTNLIHALKMFCAIFKSATRNASQDIIRCGDAIRQIDDSRRFIEDITMVLHNFRKQRDELFTVAHDPKLEEAFDYADEFMSNILEQYTYRLRDALRLGHPEEYSQSEDRFRHTLETERAYRKRQGYLSVESNSESSNSRFVYRASLLKKFAESDLFLHSDKTKDTFLIEQILYSAAAGVAMIFATVASFFFQQRYGNFTFPFLVALVVSYMFKDRLKDWLRLLFAKRVSGRIFDTKTVFHIKKKKIGWSKDSFDFISCDKLIPEVLAQRQRDKLFEQVSGKDEKVILFRKKVRIWRSKLAKVSPFPLRGINDNIRFNITEFVRKMDDPHIPLSGSWEDDGYAVIVGEKNYFLYFVFQFVFEGRTEYKRLAVKCNKNGLFPLSNRTDGSC